MELIALGLNHATAPVDVRERFSIPAARVAAVFDELRRSFAESFILSTCHRVEVHAVCRHGSSDGAALRTWFAELGRISPDQLRLLTYEHRDLDAVRHSFRVAAGLDSVVLGEQQILEQVRRAVESARGFRALGPLLDRLETGAIACGKKVRQCTDIGRHGASIVSLAVRHAIRAAGGATADARILVLGAGRAAALAVAELATLGARRVTVINRTYARAEELALRHGFAARPWDALPAALGDADLVVGGTSGAEPVLDLETVRSARSKRGGAPLLGIDLGVPRSIDPRVAELPGVTLAGLEELAAFPEAHERDRLAAERIVNEEADRYHDWWQARRVAPAIARLRSHAEAIRDRELERALARLHDLGPEERAIVRALAERITSKLLHPPTVAIKTDRDDPNLALLLERLYQSVPA